jgi:hypothetical protein
MNSRTGTVPAARSLRVPGAGSWPLFSGLGPMGALPTAPRLARAFTALVLSGWGLAAMCDTTALVASELTTNVVRAASGGDGSPVCDADGRLTELWVRLMSDRVRLRVEVWDNLPPAAGTPAPKSATPDAESGRGLELVRKLSLDWGCHPVPGAAAKSVWALLAIK